MFKRRRATLWDKPIVLLWCVYAEHFKASSFYLARSLNQQDLSGESHTGHDVLINYTANL